MSRHTDTATLGERVSDAVARFGGSWTFIFIFLGTMAIWISINVWGLRHPFDRYPFILLNLLLSCVAAIQAPVIMMSQNRQETKDRKRSEQDYHVNVKAEHEIKLLHEKLEHLQLTLDHHHAQVARLLEKLDK